MPHNRYLKACYRASRLCLSDSPDAVRSREAYFLKGDSDGKEPEIRGACRAGGAASGRQGQHRLVFALRDASALHREGPWPGGQGRHRRPERRDRLPVGRGPVPDYRRPRCGGGLFCHPCQRRDIGRYGACGRRCCKAPQAYGGLCGQCHHRCNLRLHHADSSHAGRYRHAPCRACPSGTARPHHERQSDLCDPCLCGRCRTLLPADRYRRDRIQEVRRQARHRHHARRHPARSYFRPACEGWDSRVCLRHPHHLLQLREHGLPHGHDNVRGRICGALLCEDLPEARQEHPRADPYPSCDDSARALPDRPSRGPSRHVSHGRHHVGL